MSALTIRHQLFTVPALALLCALSGCTGLRDLFRPYAPHPEEVERLLSSQTPLDHHDAALVLGCPALPDGSPSLCQRCRVKAAVRKWKAGAVDKLLFSGGAAHSPAVEAEVMAELAIALGVAPAAILREGRALTTWQNVRFSSRLLRRHGLRSVLVISTADHLPRARRIAEFWGLHDESTRYLPCDRTEVRRDRTEVSVARPENGPTVSALR